MEVMVKVARDPVPLPSTAIKKGLRSAPDKALEAICMRALSKSPKDRTASAKQLADELTSWLRDQGTGKGNLKAYRLFAVTGLAAGVVAVILLTLALLGVFSPAPPPPLPPKPKPKVVVPTPDKPAPPVLAALEVEAEAIQNAVATHGQLAAQRLAGCSGGAQLFWTGGRPQSRLTIPFQVSTEGRGALVLRMMKAQDYGIVRISLNAEQISQDLDLYSPSVVDPGPLRFPGLMFKKGVNQLEIKIVGSNSKASPATDTSELFQVGLDRLEILPQ